ncbi:MAG: transcription antitermination factor NusB [SAR86 cluster bacterium]|uniref:Transcription antitermination protein NusB n=1 Tax=SAR86 cluster bacterium TaxID=2030880 RepID=A0A2A5B698_9GAMM|nr:MAG: transcription antitermination factor NusB [SAR86 cluster bacterium]
MPTGKKKTKAKAKESLSKKTPAPKSSKPKVPLAQRRRARQLILQALYQWLIAKAEPQEIETEFREENAEKPGKVDWEYFHDVFIEIPKQAASLDEHIHPLLDRDASALDPVEKALLYLGAFELAHRVDVPYRVVINECVELAKTFGATESHKYINGVLDKLARVLRSAERSSHKKK